MTRTIISCKRVTFDKDTSKNLSKAEFFWEQAFSWDVWNIECGITSILFPYNCEIVLTYFELFL